MKTIGYNDILYRAAEAAGRTRDNLPVEEAAVLKSVFALELPRAWNGEDWDDLRQPVLAVTLDAAKAFTNPYSDPARVTVTGAGTPAFNGVYTLGGDPAYPADYFLAATTYYITYETATSRWQIVDRFNEGEVEYFATALTGPWTVEIGDAPVPTVAYTSVVALGDVLGVFDQNPDGSTAWSRLNIYRTGDTFTVTPHTGKPVAVPDTVYVYYQTACPDLLALNATELAALTLPLVFGNYLALIGAAQLLAADGAASLAGLNIGLARSELDFQRTRIQRPPWAKVS